MKVSAKNLENALALMARTIGAPEGPVWTRLPDGRNRSTVGALLIEPGNRTYGRQWRVCQIVNEAGGETILLSAWTAADLFNLIHAFLAGFRAAEARQSAREAA